MKKCPTCEKTFEDSMRFCQTDGTPLVADEPVDPYKTMVASKEEIAAAMPKEFTDAADASQDEVLDLPKESDPKKTMYVSEDELRREMAADEPVMEIPPKPEPPAPPPPPKRPTPPEPPKFSEPAATPPPSPFSTPSAPPRPEGIPEDKPDANPAFSKTSPPIPSPFSSPKEPDTSAPPKFAEPDRPDSGRLDAAASANPFEAPSNVENVSPAEWTPPPAPDASWEKQDIGENTPFQPPPASVSGVSKVPALSAFVVSVLSVPCCGFIILGLIGAGLGFWARGKVKSDPTNYGGAGLATAAIVIGLITSLIGLVGNALALLGIIPIPTF